jgi:pimeloyl-ACP methyl ester carboxylesterase
MTTAAVGGFGLADIYIGVITLPYYSGIPSEANPAAPLTDFWKAAPGAYIPPFDQIPFLDPTSTNITLANPFPVPTGVQTVPLLITVPNENSGFTKPDEGWPVVIYMHGLTRNRTDMLSIADTAARTGRVIVTMDQPLHGVVPNEINPPELAVFYIENTPFAPIANERTFDIDFWNNSTNTPGPDGLTDPSGLWGFNLGNLQATRDNIRQAEADWSILTLSLQNMSIDGDATPDLNAFDVSLVSHSAGGYVAIPYAAVEPIVSSLYVNATGGGLMRSLNGGHFGPDFVQPFLSGLAGIEPGTPEFEQYLLVAQTVLDSADSINWGAETAAKMPVIHNEVLEDGTVPNVVPGAPLAGSEALNRVMGLVSYSSSQMNPDGLSGIARFLQPADHESLFVPIYPAVTAEMQGQMATFIASGGTFVEVGNPDLLLPVAPVEPAKADVGKSNSKKGSGFSKIEPAKPARDRGVNNHD